MKEFKADIVQRWKKNPVISIDDLSFRCADICNAAAVKHKGQYILLVSVENLEGSYLIYKATSADGYNFKVEDNPIMQPGEEQPFKTYERRGVLDARITFLEGMYYIVYVARSIYGDRLGIAKTNDFTKIERIALISEPETKNGVLFPRKINGRFARLDRPTEGNSMWISYSDDLIYWGGDEVVLTPRHGYWDFHRVGACTCPIEIEEGWLEIYYGVKQTTAGPLFRLGAVIFDKDNPAKVIGRSNVPILSPRAIYERIGDVCNLVFSCGAVREDSSDELRIYYGAADSCVCAGTAKISDIVQRCKEQEERF